MTNNADTPDVSGIELDTNVLLASLDGFEIKTEEQHNRAGELLKNVKRLMNEVKETFAEPKAAADHTHKVICAAETKHMTPLKRSELTIKNLISGYIDLCERQRREAERKAQEIARKQAEEERLALAVEAEQIAGKEAADAILAAPVVVERPIVAAMPAQKISGISSRKNYKAEVIDLMALVRAVAAKEVPLSALEANMKFLNNQAKALQANLIYPGVRVIAENIIGARDH